MENNKKLLLSLGNVSIKAGWKQLNANSHKILFIIDENEKLVGSVTDGDVRRWILDENSILDPITKIMRLNPLTVTEAEPIESVKKLMLDKRVECIPVVDDSLKPVKFYFWDSIFNNKQETPLHAIDAPVVIMAGGRGTRLDPFTKILPKPLIPINDKPIIEIIIDRFRLCSVNDFFVSVNYRANMIRAYFQDVPHDYNIHFFEETKPLGTAGSLHLLKGKLKKTFIVSNCDIIIEANYAELLDFHRQQKNKITLVCSMRHFPIPYGVVEIENGGTLKNIKEKPELDYLINTGLYVLEPELLDLIPNDTFYNITHLIEKLKLENEKVGVFPISDKSWMDVGEIEEYKKTVKRFE